MNSKIKITVVDEHTGNPFKEYPGVGRKYFRDGAVMEQLWREFLPILGYNGGIKALEVGAGHNPGPAKALARMGNEAHILDADITKEVSEAVSPGSDELVSRLYQNDVEYYPRLVGKNGGLQVYEGSIEDALNPNSQLIGKKFDLVYFWGSINSGGFSYSITASTSERHNDRGPEPLGRALRPATSLAREGGTVAVISHFLNYVGDITECPENLSWNNCSLLDCALYLAVSGERQASEIIALGISRKTASEHYYGLLAPIDLENYSGKRSFKSKSRELRAKIKDEVCRDPFEAIINGGKFSMFGNTNQYQALKAAIAQTDNPESLRNSLGRIDAVAVRYGK